jgi:hypothetical protein
MFICLLDLLLVFFIERTRPMGAMRRYDILDPKGYYTLLGLIEISMVLAGCALFNAILARPRRGFRTLSLGIATLLLLWTVHRWLKPTCGWSAFEL